MVTRYEFGYGEGEIRRRRRRGQAAMRRRIEEEQEQLPEPMRKRLRYDSDYYGFRGAGTRRPAERGGLESERAAEPGEKETEHRLRRARGPARGEFRRTAIRRWARRER